MHKALKAYLPSALTLLAAITGPSLGAVLPSRESLLALEPIEAARPQCGTLYPSPRADAWSPDDLKIRKCQLPTNRSYQSKYHGIGYDLLDLESEACFVPDEAYQMLDEIVERVRSSYLANSHPNSRVSYLERVLHISALTSQTMTELGFALYIPTVQFSDALIFRRMAKDPERHIFDCDTGSMILLTVANVLGLEANLVEITLAGGSQHNYVRWPIPNSSPIDWDMNHRNQCATPRTVALPYQGKALSALQTMAYWTTIRGHTWEVAGQFDRAAIDYLSGMSGFPERPIAYNAFAWLVATKSFPERATYKDKALKAAKQAVTLDRKSDYLDTLACAYAYIGNFDEAKVVEQEAINTATDETLKSEFLTRLTKFTQTIPIDCTGDK